MTHWERAFEELQIALIHGIKIGHGGNVDVNLHNIFQSRASGLENGREILESLDLTSMSVSCCPATTKVPAYGSISDSSFHHPIRAGCDANVARAVNHAIISNLR